MNHRHSSLKSFTAPFLWLAMLTLPSGLLRAQYDWQNGAPASAVIGQPDFTSSTPNRGGAATSGTLNLPGAIAVDPTTGKVFVCDTWNSRILRYASLAALKNGTPAESVLGQPNFTQSDGDTTRSRMLRPAGMVVDSSGRLWVADYTNHRVLRFDNASAKSIGANADGVLGAADYESVSPATSQSGMLFPHDIAVDAAGSIWVADYGNNRVLRFDNAAAKANGAAADAVLGQADFASDETGFSAASMNAPKGLWLDATGSLWVSDTDNHRILRFTNAIAKGDGANADGVLGQAGFSSNDQGFTAFNLRLPSGLMVDPLGDLWVADAGNSRVLRFDKVAGKGDGAPADTVLGQPDFTTVSFTTSRTESNQPGDVFSTGADAFVCDNSNSRLLSFTKPLPPNNDALRKQLLTKVKKAKQKLRKAVKAGNKSKVRRFKKQLAQYKRSLRSL